MRNSIYTVLAIILISVGIVVFILPIPMGALMIAAGLGMLMRYSEGFAAFVKRIRYRYPNFNEFLAKVEARLPDGLRITLEVSNPDKFPDPSLIAQTEENQPWYEPVITFIAYLITQSSNFFIYLSKLFKKSQSPPESSEKSRPIIKSLVAYLARLRRFCLYLVSWISWPPTVSSDNLESEKTATLLSNGDQQSGAPPAQELIKPPPLLNEPPPLSEAEKSPATSTVPLHSHPTASDSLSNNGDIRS